MSNPTCQFCHADLAQTLVDLGSTPLANSYTSEATLAEFGEKSYPLHVRVCGECRLAQVEAATEPFEIFGDYAYFSSFSSSWMEHARRFAEMAADRWSLDKVSKVVEVASNDGYLLRNFVAAGIPVLGVEPAANVAKVAEEVGVPTDVAFFGKDTATRLLATGHGADLIVGNNVFAHVPDLNDFVAGLAILLKPDGVINLEFPHLLKLIEGVQFDTVYHEHFSYLSLYATERVLGRYGLRVFDVEELPTHGGSLRVLACHQASTRFASGPGLTKVRADEAMAQLDSDAGYEGFAPRVEAVRKGLLAFLEKTKAEGKTVVGYGAAAKGNTLLNFCSVDRALVNYVADISPHKQNKLLPGCHIPVVSPDEILRTKPDYVLILPWNLKDEITRNMAEVRGWGGKFVVAIPSLQILD
ncbi:MAG: methyltransferase domain-containing protein [Sphingomonadales bacterium]|nr:methyltransferase domain-containing protein [Sphingomonadales bacterium]